MDKFWYLFFKIYFSVKARLRVKQAIFYRINVEKNCHSFEPPLRVNGPSYVTKMLS